MIKAKTKKILESLPEGVELIAAIKDRTPEEIKEVIGSGVKAVGENYLKQAKANYKIFGNKIKWHFIGHLQKNKVRKAIKIFDLIQTLDSLKLAEVINKEAARIEKVIPVLIEVNSASEPQKFGIFPDKVIEFKEQIKNLSNLKVCGLMTMGPFIEDPEKLKPYFRQTKKIFDQIKDKEKAKDWKYLSMGMSNSWQVAIEEGANMVRIGTGIFGPRRKKI